VNKGRRLRLQVGVGIGVLVVVVALMIYGVMMLLSAKPPTPEISVRQITVLKPPPPPPPPPEVEEPPEPEIEEKIEEPEPEPEPDMAEEPVDDLPPVEDLGLDAEGVAGSDSFGLRARQGGRGLLEGGGGRFQWYAGVVRRDIEDRLLDHDELRRSGYRVEVHVWVNRGGGIRRYEIHRGSGDPILDGKIRVALGEIDAIAEVPPEGMPQPIKLRISSQL
jgi:protein TonB